MDRTKTATGTERINEGDQDSAAFRIHHDVLLERRPQRHRVTIYKPTRAAPPPRPWLECLELAEAQYKPFEAQLGRAYRIAVQVRALALYSNPHAQPHAMLPVFIPSIAALAHDLGWSESYVFRILAGKNPGSRRTSYRFKRSGQWREECKNADLELLMTWRPWLTDWACKAAGPSNRFPEGGRRTVKGGTVFYTRPHPSSNGVPRAVPAEWLEKEWRDLESDVSHQRTAKAIRTRDPEEVSCSVSKSTSDKTGGGIVRQYCQFSLTRFSTPTPGATMDAELEPRARIYAVLDMLSSDVERGHDARTNYVDGLARRICQVLRDSRWLDFWRKTLWTLLKARIYGVGGALEIVQGALWEVLIASSDNAKLKRPGALAVALMKRNGWLEVEAAVAGLYAGRARA